MDQDPLSGERRSAVASVEASAALHHHLLPGERVLWSGRPDPAREAVAPFLGCFGRVLLAVAAGLVAVLVAAVVGGALPGSTRLALGVVLAVPIGIAMGGGLLVREARRRRTRAASSLHAITDRRLLTLIHSAALDEIMFIAARSIGPVHLTPLGDDRGTITIETHSTRAGDSVTDLTQTYAWFGVPDAKRAYGLIANLQRGETLA